MAKQEKGQEYQDGQGFTGYAVIDGAITLFSLVAIGVAYYFLHPDQHPDKYY